MPNWICQNISGGHWSLCEFSSDMLQELAMGILRVCHIVVVGDNACMIAVDNQLKMHVIHTVQLLFIHDCS